MPASLKIYKDGRPEVDTYMQENRDLNMTSTAKFAKFEPAGPVKGPDPGSSFKFNPKKFFCPSHPLVEVEFCNSVSGNFYCLKCLPKYKGQKDVVLSEIIKDVQGRITELKQNYEVKKSTLVYKMTKQQKGIEDLFKIYY